MSKLYEIFCACYGWLRLSRYFSDDMLFTSGFVDDVAFAYNDQAMLTRMLNVIHHGCVDMVI